MATLIVALLIIGVGIWWYRHRTRSQQSEGGGRQPDFEEALRALSTGADRLEAAAKSVVEEMQKNSAMAEEARKRFEGEKEKAQRITGITGRIRDLLSGGGAALFFIIAMATQVHAQDERSRWDVFGRVWDWWSKPDTVVTAGPKAAAPGTVHEGTVAWSRCFADGGIVDGAGTSVVRLWVGMTDGNVLKFETPDITMHPKWRELSQVLTYGKKVMFVIGGDIKTLQIIGATTDPMLAVPYEENLCLQAPKGSDIKNKLKFYRDDAFGTREPLHAYAIFPVFYNPAGLPENQQVAIRLEIGPFDPSWVDQIMAQIHDDQLYHLVIHSPEPEPDVHVVDMAGIGSSSTPKEPPLKMVYEKGNYVLILPPYRVEFRAIIEREVDGFPATPVAGKLGPGVNELSGYEQAMQARAARIRKEAAARADSVTKAAAAAKAKAAVVRRAAAARNAEADSVVQSLLPESPFAGDSVIVEYRKAMDSLKRLGATSAVQRVEEMAAARVNALQRQAERADSTMADSTAKAKKTATLQKAVKIVKDAAAAGKDLDATIAGRVLRARNLVGGAPPAGWRGDWPTTGELKKVDKLLREAKKKYRF